MKTRFRLTAFMLSLLLTFASSGCGVSQTSVNSDEDFTTASTTGAADIDLIDALDKVAEENNFYGTIAIYDSGEKMWSYSGGYADKETEEPNAFGKIYRVGSITKQFTAAGICILNDNGKLSINDKLSKYYPDCKYGDVVTIKDMLNMASGIPDVFTKEKNLSTDSELLEYSQLGFKISENNTAEQNKLSIEKYIVSFDELEFEPQSKFEYSNSNYFLLGRIIEKVSEETYEDFIAKNIFKPLDMKSSSFDDSLLNTNGYVFDSSASETSWLKTNGIEWELYPGVSLGYAGMNSTVDDLHKWISGLSSGKLLKSETYKLMTAANELIAYESESYGFGLFTSESLCEHTGAWGTYVGQVVFNIDASKEIIFLSNYRNETMYSVVLSSLMAELEKSIQN